MNIPKIIHQIWVGKPMPDHLKTYCDSWRQLHPDWEYWLWSDADLQWLVNRDIYDRWPELAPRNAGQFRSNIGRLEILAEHGGIYADCDMEPLRPFNELLDGVDAFTSWHRPARSKKKNLLTNGLIGCTPEHPTFVKLVEGIPANVVRRKGMRSTYTTGVWYVTDEVRRQQLMDTLTVYPSHYFYPYQPDQLHHQGRKFPESWAVHHWNNLRSGGHTGRNA